MAQECPDEEDDYLNMTFDELPSSKKETSLQRTARLKKEAAARGRVLSKAELASKEKAARDEALATELDSSNKGAKIMAKMGFKAGDTLGQTEDARKQPIELLMKDDRGGIGMDSEKKRKIRDAAEALEAGEKRQKVSAEEFRERNRVEREEKRAEGLMWGAMKVLEGFEEDKVDSDGDGEDSKKNAGEVPNATVKRTKKLNDINILYRPLVKQRLERDRERQMRIELNNRLSTRNDDDSDEQEADDTIQYADDEDEELRDFEALPSTERLAKVVQELRQKYFYCFWCKHRYEGAEMEGCPGLTEDEHG
jgi:hypothetical protein